MPASLTHRPSPRVFERLAEAYRLRPGYPEELPRRLLALVPPGPRVVDLGAGTGHLAEPLARAGARVTAVEPAQAMLDVCAERTRGLEVALVLAPAESTGLPSGSAELVLLSDAAQWVDPEAAGKEAHRLLVLDGTAALVEARAADTPFMHALEQLLAEANPERRLQAEGRGRQWLALASGGAPVHTLELSQAVVLEPQALEGLLRSLSFLEPALGPSRMSALVAQAATLAAQHGGARWERVLRLSWATRRVARGGPR
jgi:ubiquinone/menaquinone biosynthesis C-methylase UbiE